MKIEQFCGRINLSVSEVMKRINENGHGILFLIDESGILQGSITDGDIRRFLLSGGQLSDLAMEAVNKNPHVAKSVESARHIFSDKNYGVIPIIDNDRRIVNFYVSEKRIERSKLKRPVNLPVVINAGGKGTRLEPFTKVLPKPLIPVGDLPIIEHILKSYRAYECEDFSIIVNYKKELIKAYFNENDEDYSINWYDEDKPLGTGGGLRLLKGKIDSTFFFVNCDVLLTADFHDIAEFHKSNGNDVTMVCAYKNMEIPYGVVEIEKDGRLKRMKEKPTVSFLTNAGIYIVEPGVIEIIGDDESIGFPDIIKRVQENKGKVGVYPVSENDWMDMGQLRELEKMRVKLYGE